MQKRKGLKCLKVRLEHVVGAKTDKINQAFKN